MAKKKQTKKSRAPEGPTYPMVFETFRKIGTYEQHNLTNPSPTCFNGEVSVIRYRVTVEQVEDPVEVIHERLKKLWHESDNYHHREPIHSVARKYGLELKSDDFGRDAKP